MILMKTSFDFDFAAVAGLNTMLPILYMWSATLN